MMFLIIILGCAFFTLAWRRLDLALAVVLFALPSYQIRFNVGIPTNLLEILVWLLFLTWLWRNRFSKVKNIKALWGKSGDVKRKIAYPFQWEIFGWLIIGFIAAGVSGFTTSALGIFKAYFFEPILFYLVAVNVLVSMPDIISRWRLVVWPLATSASLVGVVSIYQFITGDLILNPFWSAEATRRATGLFAYPNAVGLYVELIIFLTLGFIFLLCNNHSSKKIRIEKIGLGLSIGFAVTAVILAKSVGAALGIGAGLVLFIWLINRKWRAIIVTTVLVTVLVVALVPVVRQPLIRQLTLTSFSGQVRRVQWQETWKMLQGDSHWLLGAGLAGYQTAIASYHTPGIFVYDYSDPDSHRKMVWNEAYRKAHWQPLEIYLYPHNIILNFWTEIGLVGLLLFIWLIGRLIFLSARLFRRNTLSENNFVYAGIISAMVALIIHGLVDVPYFKNDLSLVFWLVVALVSVPIIELKLANK
ncbi:MAG: O-antigen ligase family protein [Candidatus Falkowbacteria bacterium]